MIVVAIVGILSAVAIPSFSAYLMRSRTAEAVQFLGAIKLRQEAYRAEFGQYCDISTYHPAIASLDGSNPVPWGATPAAWDQLGATPDPYVRFSFRTVAGTPATPPPAALGYDTSNLDFWFYSQAVGDLDDDSTLVTFESYSESSRIWVSDAKGWD